MKRSVSVSRVLLWVLIGALVLSVLGNVAQYYAATPHKPILSGTYTMDAADSRYLVFDNKGHFCLYTQTDGLLMEGNYTGAQQELYHLDSTSGSRGSVLLTEDGVYYAGADGDLAWFRRTSDIPVFAGNWAEAWAHFPEEPYVIG